MNERGRCWGQCVPDFVARVEYMLRACAETYPVKGCNAQAPIELLVGTVGDVAINDKIYPELNRQDPASQVHFEHLEREDGGLGRCRLSSLSFWTCKLFWTKSLYAPFVLLNRKAGYVHHTVAKEQRRRIDLASHMEARVSR